MIRIDSFSRTVAVRLPLTAAAFLAGAAPAPKVDLLVNGAPVVDEGRPTGALPGRPLAKPRDPSWSCPA